MVNLENLQIGDIIIHELYGELTILQKDSRNKRYLVIYGEIAVLYFIDFKDVKRYCKIKS